MAIQNPTVAVVDDDDVLQMMVGRLFSLYAPECQIEKFYNGEKILSHLKTNAANRSNLPDIILLDVNMPLMNGWAFLDEYQSLKAQLSKLPKIYLVTSSSDSNDVKRASMNSNIVEHVIKPVTNDFIVRIISELKVSSQSV
jgi:CheY-like chemotaxis protein